MSDLGSLAAIRRNAERMSAFLNTCPKAVRLFPARLSRLTGATGFIGQVEWGRPPTSILGGLALRRHHRSQPVGVAGLVAPLSATLVNCSTIVALVARYLVNRTSRIQRLRRGRSVMIVDRRFGIFRQRHSNMWLGSGNRWQRYRLERPSRRSRLLIHE